MSNSFEGRCAYAFLIRYSVTALWSPPSCIFLALHSTYGNVFLRWQYAPLYVICDSAFSIAGSHSAGERNIWYVANIHTLNYVVIYLVVIVWLWIFLCVCIPVTLVLCDDRCLRPIVGVPCVRLCVHITRTLVWDVVGARAAPWRVRVATRMTVYCIQIIS